MMLKRRPFLIRKMLIIVNSSTQINVTASHFIIGVEVCSVITQVKKWPCNVRQELFTSCTCTCIDHKHREIRGDWERGVKRGGGTNWVISALKEFESERLMIKTLFTTQGRSCYCINSDVH